MKVMIVMGTRPEMIKLAPVISEAKRRENKIELLLCSTGQHREMLDQAMSVFNVTPDIELDIMCENQSLSELTSRLIDSLSKVISENQPDVVVVQGDTASAFTAALAAFYLHIPVAHVEAGLRTGDINSPFPEELNRVMIGRIAHWHFTPTLQAKNNLIKEGVESNKIFITGNTVVDAIEMVQSTWKKSSLKNNFPNYKFNIAQGVVVDDDGNSYVVGDWVGNAILTVKYNSAGVEQWQKKYTATNDAHASGVAIDSSGDIYVSGWVNNGSDDDYLLGNLGENHRFTVSKEYPLRIYALDLDKNGTIDPISTGYWRNRYNEMKEYPVNYLDELVGQAPYFSRKYSNYTSFSKATMDDILDDDMRMRIDHLFHVESTSSQLLWNDKGGFRWEKLPEEAQVSPIAKTIVRDFNKDGLPDILLAGNDHTYDISTGYYDALKGLILMSDGGKPLSRIVNPSESGIVLHGMVESLLLLEGEKPLVVAGMNRDSLLLYSVNLH